jgi:diguanylate cyclase (GGDEF)-like protein
MIEARTLESQAHLRHEYRTPVNHIIGYSELLIEEAGERHLESFIPIFERIHEGGRELLESIQSAFSEHVRPGNNSEREVFRANIRVTALELSHTLTSLAEDFERCHRQTNADLDAISWAIRRLLELAGLDSENATAESFKPARGVEDLSCEAVTVPARLDGGKRGGGKILIADDDAANRTLLRRRLECDGHEVVEAKDGLEVLESLKDSPCDLVLLDIMMPAMDGFQTLARMKMDSGLRDLPVIMISALDELRSVVRCIEMGADDYLTKPFNRVLLRARIGASLEKKWLRDRERRKTEELEQTLQMLEQAQEQLALLASRDPLTGLANRRSVEAHLDFLARRGTPFTAIYIDLNGFKKINDTYGHSAGDDLLKQVGDHLRRAFRATDVVGRWGGDEFVALADESFPDVQVHMSRIAECLAHDFVISKGEAQQRVQIGAAVGVAAWKRGDAVSELLHRADFAMYEEKLRIAG